MSSYVAFLPKLQIAHKVTDSLTKDACDNNSIMEKSQSLELGSVEALSWLAKYSSAKAQTHLAEVHSNNEWRQESGAPYKPHEVVVDIFRWDLTSSVVSDCLAILHKNIRTLPGTLTFHKYF